MSIEEDLTFKFSCCACGKDLSDSPYMAIESEVGRRKEERNEKCAVPIIGVVCKQCLVKIENGTFGKEVK